MTQKTAMPGSVSNEEALIAKFRDDPAVAASYLELAMREGSKEEFLVALRRVTKAYGGIAKLAEATGLNENTLHRTLSAKGNPRLDTFVKVCDALGMQIHISPATGESHAP